MRRSLLLLSLLVATSAQAGLFSDDEARKQVQQLEGRVLKLEQELEQRIEQKFEQRLEQKLDESNKQQTRSMLDLQGQIDALNTELRKLRGLNEELSRGLQDAEKREKDFYVDLDTRLRHFESKEEAASAALAVASAPVAAAPVDPSDPAPENRAFEAAYGLFKSGNHENAIKAFQEFLNQYPDSAHVANANYWLGNAQFALKDYQNALDTYQGLLKTFPSTPKAAEVLFNIAGCQHEMKHSVAAQKTLKQLVARYPDSEAAGKARKLITTK